MNIRPFGWRDFPLLYNYRKQGLFLDSSRALIHGPALIPLGALFTFLGPATRSFTYRCENCSPSGKPLIGQVTYVSGSSYARLAYLAPVNTIDLSDLSAFSDYMAGQLGRQGVFHILAEIDESSQEYQGLRRVGFAIYARQRIWRLNGPVTADPDAASWRAFKPSDMVGIRNLYGNVVPAIAQQVESIPKKNLQGFVHYHNGDIRAFVELKYGRHGVWVQPYIHPDVENFDRQLVNLLAHLPTRHNRPLYLCVRSYQSWLEAAIETIGGLPGPQQAVMVRHLTVANRVKQTYPLTAINGTHAEPTAPIAHFEEDRHLELAEIDKHPSTDSATGV